MARSATVVLVEEQGRGEEVLRDAISLLGLAASRARASRCSDERLKARIQEVLEAARQELVQLRDGEGEASPPAVREYRQRLNPRGALAGPVVESRRQCQ
jgi:hypothetical protein